MFYIKSVLCNSTKAEILPKFYWNLMLNTSIRIKYFSYYVCEINWDSVFGGIHLFTVNSTIERQETLRDTYTLS